MAPGSIRWPFDLLLGTSQTCARQVEAVLASGGKYFYDASSLAYYVVKGDQWISVEMPGVPPAVASPSDPPIGSIARKARFIQEQGLGGAMFWEVGSSSSNLPSSLVPVEHVMDTLASIRLSRGMRDDCWYGQCPRLFVHGYSIYPKHGRQRYTCLVLD